MSELASSPAMQELCVCPRCRGTLAWSSAGPSCSACGARYRIEEGVPVLVEPPDRPRGGPADDPVGEHKRHQARHFDAAAGEWEVERPRGAPALHRWLLEEKLRRGLRGLGALRGRTALVVCAGSGMDAEVLARAGARVVSSDISSGACGRALERGRRSGVDLAPVVADAERLPFADRSFDLVFVHDGLHHLEDPLAGIAEMTRVARWAISVNEPTRAAATALAVRLGLAREREEAGNLVVRLPVRDYRDAVEAAGFEIVGCERYAMRYGHEPGAPTRALSRPPFLQLSRGAIRALNAVAGPIGNKLSLRALRRPDQA